MRSEEDIKLARLVCENEWKDLDRAANADPLGFREAERLWRGIFEGIAWVHDFDPEKDVLRSPSSSIDMAIVRHSAGERDTAWLEQNERILLRRAENVLRRRGQSGLANLIHREIEK